MKKAFWKRLGAAMLSVATIVTMLPSMAFATDESGDAAATLPTSSEEREGQIDFGAPTEGGILEVKDAYGAVYRAYTDEKGRSYVQGPEEDAYAEKEEKEGILFTLTEESGSLLEVTMRADDGYKVEAYRISIDGGAEEKVEASAEQEKEFSFELNVSAEQKQKVTAVFAADETKEKGSAAAKEGSKETGKKASKEEAKKDASSGQAGDTSAKDSEDKETASEDSILPITPAETQTTTEYIEEKTDMAEEELSPVDYIAVAATSVSCDLFPATIDNLWADRDKDGNWDNLDYFLGQTNSKVYLYDSDPDSDYYVGKVDNFGVEGAKLTDWCAVKNDTSGTVYEDVIFDKESGLVYVPKKYTKTDESGNPVYASVRIQLLYQIPSSKGEDVSTKIQVTIHKGEAKGEIAESGLIEAGFYDGKTSFQLAKDKEAIASIKELEIAGVKINGVIADEEDGSWSYDEKTGVFSLNMIASSISSVEIVIGWDNPELLSFQVTDESSIMVASQHNNELNPKGYPIKWTEAQLAYIDGWTFSSNPSVGDCFELSADNVFHQGGYEWGIYSALPGWYQDWHKYFANQMPDDMLSLDSAGIDVPATLAYSLFTNSGIDLSEGYYTYNATEGNNYQRIIGIKGKQTVTVLDGTKKLTTSGDYETINLFCSHANIPDGSYGADSVWMRVLTTSNIKTNADGSTSGFSVVGFVSPVTYAQAGSGLIGLYWTVPAPETGKLNITKTSAAPSVTNGNDCYSLEGALYSVYYDEKCTNKIGTLKLKKDGNAEAPMELKVGTYYVKESKAPKGYKLSSEVKKVTIASGKTTTVSFQDEPSLDPIGIKLYKIDSKTGEHPGK